MIEVMVWHFAWEQLIMTTLICFGLGTFQLFLWIFLCNVIDIYSMHMTLVGTVCEAHRMFLGQKGMEDIGSQSSWTWRSLHNCKFWDLSM